MEQRIYFNGIDLSRRGTGNAAYSRKSISYDKLLARLRDIERDDPLLNRDVVDGVEPNDLSDAGWGLIVHEREDPAVLEALQPLLAQRRLDAGERFYELPFLDGDNWETFLDRYKASPSLANPKRLPYYLLIVGEPTLIPFAFQYEMDVSYAVGRICLPSIEAYAQYVANVLAHERSQPPERHRLSLFGPNNREPLTNLSCLQLMLPLHAAMKEKRDDEDQPWHIESYTGWEASRARLDALILEDKPPSVLFTTTHGTTSFGDPSGMEPTQGGLVCSDYDASGKIKPSHCFFSQDLPYDVDLRGMISFNFGCFTSGTPQFDGMTLPGEEPRQLYKRPFVSALHQRMLGIKHGALAAIGHVDSAFQHGFMWNENYRDIDHFTGTLARLLKGNTVGWAMEYFNRRLADVSARIMGQMFDSPKPKELVRLQQWLAYLDARNYAVLGDPAVRLNVQEES